MTSARSSTCTSTTTGRPHWLLVDTGFFPNFFSVIPVTDVLVSDRGLEVHYTMEKLTGAPNNMKDKDYAKHREGTLYDYYRLEAPVSVVEATKHGPADDGTPAAQRAVPLLDAVVRQLAHGVQRRVADAAGRLQPSRGRHAGLKTR